MKELAAILDCWKRGEAEGSVLATVVKTVGSSYRRAGAHMLVLANGKTIGSVSGGCLEQDVIAHAELVRASGEVKLLSYDTTPEEDVLFGVGLGCKGVIEILVEPVSKAAEKLRLIDEIFAGGDVGVIRHEYRGEIVFEQTVHAPTRLLIFGAGYDAVPLARLASELGFLVTVVDRRPAYVTSERFLDAQEVVIASGLNLPDLKINGRTAAVVMAHHYLSDRDYLKALLPLPLSYLGLMGPRRRAEKMLQEIREEGVMVGDELLGKLHNPVGLDIGAEGPEEIALAILAEINAVLAGHGGGMLREKKGPIHWPRREPQ
jgi:xanthine/CO dehydrogenase XdhC/CoxF family maturation factor